MVHYFLIACAAWAALSFLVVTYRQIAVRGDQGYFQPLFFIAMILALGFLGLGA